MTKWYFRRVFFILRKVLGEAVLNRANGCTGEKRGSMVGFCFYSLMNLNRKGCLHPSELPYP